MINVRRTLSQVLIASGLVIVTSPLCFMASAQQSSRGYVDLEAERAAREAAGGRIEGVQSAPRGDPYGARPAQSYPATSYGVNGAAAAPVANAPAGTSSANGSSSNLGNLFYQLQQLQQEVMRLNGKVEEQGFELRRLQEQSRERYLDIDKRLGAGATGAPPVAHQSGQQSTQPAVRNGDSPALVFAGANNGKASGEEQPGEAEAYQAAYGLVIGRQFDEAIPAFEAFLSQHPAGKYAPNAHYWLGELFLVKEPPDLESSRQSFALLLSEYPSHAKAPDALYKLGTVQYMKGNREKAREYLDLVVSQYSSSNAAVTKLARDFIAANY